MVLQFHKGKKWNIRVDIAKHSFFGFRIYGKSHGPYDNIQVRWKALWIDVKTWSEDIGID